MDYAEGGVSKHLKLPVEASGRRLATATAPARLRTAMTRKIAGYGLPVAGIGGVSASVTAVSAHHVSTVALVASGAMVITTVVVHYAAKCFGSYFRHQAEIVRARGAADEARIKLQADCEVRKAREDTRQTLIRAAIDEPAKEPVAGRMLARHDLVTLAEQRELTGQELYRFATLLLGDQSPESNPPREGKGVKQPRPVCPQARTGRTPQARLAQPPTRI